MKEGEADNEHSNPVLLPLVPEFTTSAFLIYSCYTFKNFLLEVVAIGRKNAGWEYDYYSAPCLLGVSLFTLAVELSVVYT